VKAALWFAAALATSGCATYERGPLAAAAVEPLPLETHVVQQEVEGRACDLDSRYDRALELALAQAPGANGLIHVRYAFERFCLVVRGTAVRVGAAASP
jgi:hypothetical protein